MLYLEDIHQSIGDAIEIKHQSIEGTISTNFTAMSTWLRKNGVPSGLDIMSQTARGLGLKLTVSEKQSNLKARNSRAEFVKELLKELLDNYLFVPANKAANKIIVWSVSVTT